MSRPIAGTPPHPSLRDTFSLKREKEVSTTRFLVGDDSYRQSFCNYNRATVSAYILEGVRTSRSKKYAPLHLEPIRELRRFLA